MQFMKRWFFPVLAIFLIVGVVCSKNASSNQAESGDKTLKPKDTGYRGIWFTLGQYHGKYKEPNKRYWQGAWKYGDKYSGGLGTYTSSHEPIAIYAPEVKKTFFCYGGSKNGECYLYNMISYYDHEKDRVPRPTILHDKGGVDDPHDDSSMAIDAQGHIWVYVAGRGRIRPGFVYRSVKPYDIERFERISSDTICYPQPHAIAGQGILELFTKYDKKGRQLYWNVRHPDGSRDKDRNLAKMEGQYQVSARQGSRVITAFNRHPKGQPDNRTDLYYVETRDLGKTWQTADGVTIEPPLVKSVNPALVRAYSKEKRNVYINNVTLDNDGNSVILYVTSSLSKPGPKGDPRTWEVAHHKDGQWHFSRVTNSTHNYDMGTLWVEKDGTWRILGPTEPGPQRWGAGGEIAVWTSTDEGVTWTKVRQVTHDSPRNHTYVRRVIGAEPDSPFFALWADGDTDKKSISRLYFTNRNGSEVRVLPYDMDGEYATPEVMKYVP